MNMPDLPSIFAIAGGHVIDPANEISGKLNVIVENGRVKEITPALPKAGTEIINAEGLIVVPGLIDLHIHLREPGFEYKEDIESGTQAAASGGFTSVFCMPNTRPACDSIETVNYINKRASSVSPVEVYPVGAISRGLKGEELVDIAGMADAGVVAISDDGSSIQNSELMEKAMKIAADANMLVISHPEDFAVSKGGVINDGQIAKKLGLSGIPEAAENNIIERDIKLAGRTGARLHIAHVSTSKGVALVRNAKKAGLKVSCEVTPHHLALTEDACAGRDPNTKMNPPLRTETDRKALIAGIIDGTVDAIATDHAPHAASEKTDIEKAPFGVIGLETALSVALKTADENNISLDKLIELFTAGPAHVAKIGRGTLAVGAKANITIFDPDFRYTIDPGKFRSKSRNCPFKGWDVRGKIIYTIVNGKIVYKAE